ncbi:LacI family DNA-binding transcriptional regulator [Erwinia sp. P6884]|uniref:LacI family DNA-binding transcriptional regulator n=1 Tax=Erwinia sp. P6884 TaxID=3141450 RepID=UPI0031868DFF
MKKITLDELARRAGVGVATVDRVLNERGGVLPATAQKVLQAARESGLKRILPEEHRHPWQIEVLLSGNGSYFFRQLSDHFSKAATGLGHRRLTLRRTFIPETKPQKLAAHIAASSATSDGLIVYAHDYPVVHEALALCKARGVPVITLVTDLPGAERLCHVGINQLQAGRTAGLLMGKMVSGPGEVIMVSGRSDYRAHQERIRGFRDVLTARFPHVTLREVLAGEDRRETISRLLETELARAGDVAGIYNTGQGNREIDAALMRHRLAGKCVFITHELSANTRTLLAADTLSLTLDQNARQHAQLAIELMINYLDSGEVPDLYSAGKVAFTIHTPENII